MSVLLNPAFPAHSRQLKDIQATAPAFGVTVLSSPVTGDDDIDRAFATMRKKGAEGLLVLGGPLLGNHRLQIVDLAAKSRLPAIFAGGGRCEGWRLDVVRGESYRIVAAHRCLRRQDPQGCQAW